MTDHFYNTLNTISFYEKSILKANNYNAIWLGKNLTALMTLRKELYSYYFKNSKDDIEIKTEIVDEYERYCIFTRKLLTTKKLPHARYFEILEKYLNAYNLIKTIDTDRTAYVFTLQTLNDLKCSTKNCPGQMKGYRLRGIHSLTRQFIAKNATQERII